MSATAGLQKTLRTQAAAIAGRLTPQEREALLTKCWMSHDARWFMAVAKEYGLTVANRLNQEAVHETGKVEARRLLRALGLPRPASVDDLLQTQEVLISLFGPDLLDYSVTKESDDAFRIDVERCFAHDNAERAGIAAQYDCGIFARITGWLDAFDLPYEMTPPLGPCLKAQGRACAHTMTLGQGRPPATATDRS